MKQRVAIVGAGVSGLTCGVILAEHGYRPLILAEETNQETNSAAAAAIWYPYDAEPANKVIPWALNTYKLFLDLARDPKTGVSRIELRMFSRSGMIQVPDWADNLDSRMLKSTELLSPFVNGFALTVPLIDPTFYLDYLANRFRCAGGEIHGRVRINNLDEIDRNFSLVINCAGIGAGRLVSDPDLEPHRGQVITIPKRPGLDYAIVSDDPPLMYVIPRRNDCVLGGTNEVSGDRQINPATSARIVAECNRVLNDADLKIVGVRVGLRPFRKSGVRLETDRLRDGRAIVHNYGHGGAGFTLSWACAQDVARLVHGLS
jgi:D-amino-acid oxidase